MDGTVYLEVDKSMVKGIKEALDRKAKFIMTRTIERLKDGRCLIPTVISADRYNRLLASDQEPNDILLNELGLKNVTNQISMVLKVGALKSSRLDIDGSPQAMMNRAVCDWIQSMGPGFLESNHVSPGQLLESCPKFHARYPPMLMLSKTAFVSDPWMRLLGHDSSSSTLIQGLYQRIANAFQVTHLAKIGHIPLEDERSEPTSPRSNILRSPTRLVPLFGDIGDYVPHPRSSLNLPSTLWVTVKQNGIHQCWAPLYTMFSQGNVTEKHRLLHCLLAERLDVDPAQSTAVDLFAGIGYFSFSYATAGFKRVLCWELNPWSVEGLRRGAAMNKCGVLSAPLDGDRPGGTEIVDSKEKIVVFEEDNARASERINGLRGHLPPVRHVNCGMLPSSRSVWGDAIEILDPDLGGWIHVHENIADADRSAKVDDIQAFFCHHAAPLQVTFRGPRPVKSYGPRVTHYVLDVQVSPM